jgi:hypothetical protein
MRPAGITLALCLAVCLNPAGVLTQVAEIRFTDVTQQAGLGAPLAGMMAHAAAWGDFDGDGDLDLFTGGFADRPDDEYAPAHGPVGNRVFRNISRGRFELVAAAGVDMHARTSHAVFVDLDNDGNLDLYVANNSRTSSRLADGTQREAQLRRSAVFRNDHGAFADVTGVDVACLTLAGAARSVGAFDYDGDGLLDLLILEDRFGPSPRSRLCRNLGTFRFADVTPDAGLPADLFGLGLAIGDLNADGRSDIFVSHSNRLFISTKQGGYTEPAGPKATFAWKPLDREDWPAGAVFADLNRDARLDLIVGIHHERARNRVYLNEGVDGDVPRFRDVSSDAGLPPQLTTKSPHVEAQDFDNDGWLDLYFSAAWLDSAGNVTPMVFRNAGLQRGIPQFDSPRQSPTARRQVYFPAGPSGDYDGDGRIDLFLANWFRGNHSRLLKNVSGTNRWLDVSVRGRTINRMGIGAKVYVYKTGELHRDAGLLGFQEIGTGFGFGSGQAAGAHFGTGRAHVVDVLVRFPDGSEKSLHGVDTDTQLIVEQPR